MIIKNPLIIKKAKLQAKTATPTTSSQTITADSGYDGLSEVDIQAVNSSIDSNIQAENIKKDVTILGVTGTLESGGGTSKLPQVIDGSITELTAEDFGDATSLNIRALSGLTKLTSLIIPEQITYIDKYVYLASYKATSLHFNAINASNNYAAIQYGSGGSGNLCGQKSTDSTTNTNITIYIGNKVTQIPKYQFAPSGNNSSRFINVIFDDNSVCTTLNSGCFSWTNISNITIPNSVTSIGTYAFSGCTGLTEMTILATTPPTLSSTNAISQATKTIYIPAGTLEAYQTATNWSSFASKFVELSE